MAGPLGKSTEKEIEETMTTRNITITLTAAIASLIVSAPQMVAKTAGDVTVAKEARETLKDLKGFATKAAGSAEDLEFLSQRNTVSADSHLPPLIELREDVNTMGKEIASLEAQRDSLEPWEQAAVDKVVPLLKEAADNTQGAIHYFNESRLGLWTPNYRSYVQKVQRDSDQIAQTLKDYMKYESVREAEVKLESAIGAGSN